MEILNVNGKQWLVGLEWEILPGDSNIKLETRDIAKKTALPYGIAVEYDSTHALGLTKKLKGNVKPAAVFLAAANQIYRESDEMSDYPDWIVIEEAKDDKYWMAVIKSGIPAPQYDAILSLTEIKERITELLINDTFTVFSSSQEIINIFDGIKDIQNRGINELTEDINIKYKFDKLLGIPTSVLWITGITFIIGCFLTIIFMVLESVNKEERARLLKDRLASEEIQRRIVYEKEKADYEQIVKETKQNKLDEIIVGLSGNPTEILTAFYNNVGGTEIGSNGWILTEIECYFNVAPKLPDGSISDTPQAACDYVYNRPPLATTKMFLSDHKDENVTLNGDVAKIQKIVNIDPKYISKAPESVLSTIRPSVEWSINVLSQLQLLKVASIDSKVGQSTEISYTIPGEPLTPDEKKMGAAPKSPKTINLGIGMGEIVVSGKNFDLIKELADNVDFTSTSLKKINYKVTNGNTLDWAATFTYYISTLDGEGVGASGSKTETNESDKK